MAEKKAGRGRGAARTAVVGAVATVLAVAGALPASAHVVADPNTAPGGGYGVITLRVPNESSTSSTVKLQITLPTDRPITSVRTEPMAGWTSSVQKAPLPAPVSLGEGETATESVRSVTWTAQPGTKIGPNQFALFRISAGPLPAAPGTLELPAVQTYDNGRTVSWSDPPAAAGAPEPEHPAPSVTLVADSSDGGATAGSTDDGARWLGGAGLVLGALGFALGLVAFVRSRRGSAPPPAA